MKDLRTFRRVFVTTGLLLVFCGAQVSAITQDGVNSVIKNTPFYLPGDRSANCSGSYSTTNGGALGPSLEGHSLPAASGGVGQEQPAVVRPDGKVVLAPGAVGAGTGMSLSPKGVTQNDATFYMNMRLRYVLWAWDGSSTLKGAPEKASWYTEAVRKVLITNPKNGKSVVAALLETGPAPWGGTKLGSASRKNPPPYWQGYIDGTPAGYDGRVGGVAPATMEALGGSAQVQWMHGGDSGVALQFSWADQSLPSGTVIEGGKVISAPSSGGGGSSCAAGSDEKAGNLVLYSQYDARWKNAPYGSSTIGESGCGPASMAMIIATLSDKSVTPVDVATYGASQGTYIAGSGSAWTLPRIAAEHWGLKAQDIGKDMNAATTALQNGNYVIATGQGPVPFTSGGHFIVLRGMDDGGKILVGDPAHKEANTAAYDVGALAGSIRNMWIITK